MGKAVARPVKPKADRLIEAETALRMHLAGVEDSTICRELRISRSTLKRRIAWALQQVVDPTVEQYRQEATARIRESRRRIYQMLEAQRPHHNALTGAPVIDPKTGTFIMEPVCGPAEVAALTGRLRELEETEAKLRGGFAPTKVDHTVTVNDALETLFRELEANDGPRPVDGPVPRV